MCRLEGDGVCAKSVRPERQTFAERGHGKHIAYDQERNEPLCNLFLTMLHKLEIAEPRFGTSTGPLKGLA